MDEKGQGGLKEQRDKRKRVHIIKNGIVAIISIWLVLSIIITAALCVKVFSLQKQIDVLTGEYTMEKAAQEQEASNAPAPDTQVIAQQTSPSGESQLTDPDNTLKVYLTFDDGPSENSNEILDILANYGVKATFFVIGKDDDASKAVYQRIINEGHSIGMHSYSHKYSEIYASLDAFKEDYNRIHNLIYDATGTDCKLYRFPGGSSNKVSNTDMKEFIRFMNQQGVTYYDWNVSSGDATSQAYTSDELVENVMGDVVKYKTSVVLLHDATSKAATVQALPKLIETLQSQGAVLLPISEDTTVIQHVKAADVG